VGIVSSALTREIDFGLEKLGVSRHVAFVVGAERVVAAKPDPSAYLAAIEELRHAGHAGPAVAVEDSAAGATAAKRARLRCVGVTHSCGRSDLLRAGADATAANLAALTDDLLEGGV
jgi:beta-phosphoglucomutase-like phosphatase (HAD superfamily)